jgi:mono/diheme cytochrome c family protein
MNIWVIAGIALVLIGLRFLKPNTLVWLGAFWVGFFVLLKWGIVPAVPGSIRGMFLGIHTVALLLYASADAARASETNQGLRVLLFQRKWLPVLIVLLLVWPVSLAWSVYQEKTAAIAPPPTSRTIHPAPPQEITVRGRRIDILHDENPYRKLEKENPSSFAAHLENGRAVYYQNCVFCHGDDMRGDGLYAYGLDPIPANFNDPTTIGMLTETYLLWRIAKGGPGLPEEGTPWNSAMPAWEDRLSEEQMWDVILFLYQFTGLKPRAVEAVE